MHFWALQSTCPRTHTASKVIRVNHIFMRALVWQNRQARWRFQVLFSIFIEENGCLKRHNRQKNYTRNASSSIFLELSNSDEALHDKRFKELELPIITARPFQRRIPRLTCGTNGRTASTKHMTGAYKINTLLRLLLAAREKEQFTFRQQKVTMKDQRSSTEFIKTLTLCSNNHFCGADSDSAWQLSAVENVSVGDVRRLIKMKAAMIAHPLSFSLPDLFSWQETSDKTWSQSSNVKFTWNLLV